MVVLSGGQDSFVTALLAREACESVRPEFRLVAPLLDKSKADIFAIAERFKQLPELLSLTRTCYTNSSQPNAWGFGCGACPACKLRSAGWKTFQQRKMAIHGE